MIKTTRYFSYLLRIWQSENQGHDEWFVSLEDPKSREILYFKTMDEMFSFIREIQTLNKNSLNTQIE